MVHAKNEYQMIYTGCPKITIHCHLFLFFVSDIIRRDVKSSEFDSLGLAAFQVYHSLVHGLPIDVTIIQHDRLAGSFFSTCLQLSECFWSFMAVKLLQRVAQFTLSKVSGNSICSLKLLSGRKVTTTNEKKNTELLEQAFEQSQEQSTRRAGLHQQNQYSADASQSNKGRFVPTSGCSNASS